MAKKRPSLTSNILSGKSSLMDNSKERLNERREQQQEEIAISEHIDGFLAIEDIIVDPKLEYTIRVQDEQEFDQFKKNLITDGKIRDAIVVTKNFGNKPLLVDGHHRLKASKALYKEYPIFAKVPVVYKEFPSLEALTIWMLTNQIGRRNLTKEERLHLALKLQQLGYFVKIAQENRGKRTDLQQSKTSRPNERDVEKPKNKAALIDTHVAELAQVSVADAKRMRRVKEENPVLYQQIIDGKRSISNAYNQVQKEKKAITLTHPELQELDTPYKKVNISQMLQDKHLLSELSIMTNSEILEHRIFEGIYGLDAFQVLETNKKPCVFISYLFCTVDSKNLSDHFLSNLGKNAHYSFIITVPSLLAPIQSKLSELSLTSGIIIIDQEKAHLEIPPIYKETNQDQYINIIEKLLFWK